MDVVQIGQKCCSGMTQLVERKRKDGSAAFVAQINVRQNGKWGHRESRTFDKRSSAAAWCKSR